jgi:hypothetical protein
MSKTTSPKTRAEYEDFDTLRDEFISRVFDANIPPLAFKLAWIICFKHMCGVACAACATEEMLACDLGVTVRTVRRLVNILRPLGLDVRPHHGRGGEATYCIDDNALQRGEERS